MLINGREGDEFLIPLMLLQCNHFYTLLLLLLLNTNFWGWENEEKISLKRSFATGIFKVVE